MRLPETKVIGDQTYQVTPLPAGRGLKVMARLLRLLGPALGEIPSLKALESAAPSAISAFMERLEGEDLEATCLDFAEFTQVGDGQKMVPLKGIFDLHFQGDYFGLYEWLRFAMEVNFGPLVSKLKGLFTDRRAASAGPAA